MTVEYMKSAFVWAREQHLAINSRTVTYRRLTQSVAIAQAMIGGRQPVPLNAQGMQRDAGDFTAPTADEYQRDYFVRPGDLVFSPGTDHAEAFIPAQGDFIDDANDETGVVHRYEVTPITGMPEYEKRDFLVWLRIHTKHFGAL